MKDILAAYDTEYLSDFELTLHASFPTAHNLKQGFSRSSIEINASGGETALKMNCTGADPFRFVADDQNSYDATGNYFVSHEIGQFIMIDANEARVLHLPELLLIGKDSSILKKSSLMARRMEKLDRNHADALNQVYRYILPLGRGFSMLMGEVNKVSIDANGIADVESSGTLYSSYPGLWRLKVDTLHEYLIIGASFTRQGNATPDFTSQCSPNLMTGPLCASGVCRFSDYEITVSSAVYSSQPNATAISEARMMTDPVKTPANIHVLDFRRVNSDGLPTISLMKPGE
jgi:hypothetical protein